MDLLNHSVSLPQQNADCLCRDSNDKHIGLSNCFVLFFFNQYPLSSTFFAPLPRNKPESYFSVPVTPLVYTQAWGMPRKAHILMTI